MVTIITSHCREKSLNRNGGGKFFRWRLQFFTWELRLQGNSLQPFSEHESPASEGCDAKTGVCNVQLWHLQRKKLEFEKETSKYGSYFKAFLGMVLQNKNNSITVLKEAGWGLLDQNMEQKRQWQRSTGAPACTATKGVKPRQQFRRAVLTCFLSVALRDLAA